MIRKKKTSGTLSTQADFSIAPDPLPLNDSRALPPKLEYLRGHVEKLRDRSDVQRRQGMNVCKFREDVARLVEREKESALVVGCSHMERTSPTELLLLCGCSESWRGWFDYYSSSDLPRAGSLREYGERLIERAKDSHDSGEVFDFHLVTRPLLGIKDQTSRKERIRKLKYFPNAASLSRVGGRNQEYSVFTCSRDELLEAILRLAKEQSAIADNLRALSLEAAHKEEAPARDGN